MDYNRSRAAGGHSAWRRREADQANRPFLVNSPKVVVCLNQRAGGEVFRTQSKVCVCTSESFSSQTNTEFMFSSLKSTTETTPFFAARYDQLKLHTWQMLFTIVTSTVSDGLKSLSV